MDGGFRSKFSRENQSIDSSMRCLGFLGSIVEIFAIFFGDPKIYLPKKSGRICPTFWEVSDLGSDLGTEIIQCLIVFGWDVPRCSMKFQPSSQYPATTSHDYGTSQVAKQRMAWASQQGGIEIDQEHLAKSGILVDMNGIFMDYLVVWNMNGL